MKAFFAMALLGVSVAGGQAPVENPVQDERKTAEAKIRYEEARREEMLRQEAIAMADHREIRLQDLPPHIIYEKGKRSLVLNPKEPSQAILINDTPDPVAGIESEFTLLMPEAKIDGRWERCVFYGLGCASFASTKDLAPRSAYLLREADVTSGDQVAEMRFSLRNGTDAIMVSPVFQGRYESKGLAKARCDVLSYRGISEDIERVLLSPSGWSDGVARTPEEIVAALELERAYDHSYRTRENAVRWLEKAQTNQDLTVELIACAARMKAILAEDWSHALDDGSRLERCIKALEANGDAPYGTPERCRTVVWRTLCAATDSQKALYLTLEQQDAGNARRSSGNPWGATPEQLATISKAADRSIRSGNASEADAAARLLAVPGWPKDIVPDSRLLAVLDKVGREGRTAVVRKLVAGGKRAEVRRWLTVNQERLGDDLGGLWGESLGGGIPEEGDLSLFKAALARGPGVVGTIGLFQIRDDWWRREAEWSPPYRAALREMLEREASRKTFLGAVGRLTGKDGRSLQPPEEHLKDRKLQELAHALQVLSDWKMAEDTPLFRKFLDHPGRGYAYHSELGNVRTYPVREAAARILASRGEKLPAGLVLQEKDP